jgi:hypothetical protein
MPGFMGDPFAFHSCQAKEKTWDQSQLFRPGTDYGIPGGYPASCVFMGTPSWRVPHDGDIRTRRTVYR